MTSVRVKGYITEDGHIEIELPNNFIAGEAEFDIPVSIPESSSMTLGDILKAGLFGIGADDFPEDMDSQEWVEQQREQRRQNRGQNWMDS